MLMHWRVLGVQSIDGATVTSTSTASTLTEVSAEEDSIDTSKITSFEIDKMDHSNTNTAYNP